MDSELLNLSVRHIHDVLALTLGAANDFAEIARTRGLRAARLKIAKDYILENSHRREISVGSVAAHLCVTPRYLQRLFEETGTTFSEFLVKQRLAQAHRLLSESDSNHSAISTIAYDVGFGDLSYFNRRFRRSTAARLVISGTRRFDASQAASQITAVSLVQRDVVLRQDASRSRN